MSEIQPEIGAGAGAGAGTEFEVQAEKKIVLDLVVVAKCFVEREARQ